MRCNIYDTGHPLSTRMCQAFAKGSKGDIVSADTYVPGVAVCYGILRGCGEIIDEATRRGDPFIHIDHGYFGRGDYYRVTANDYQQRELLDVGGSRFKWELEPWKTGTYIYIRPPSELWAKYRGIDLADWVVQCNEKVRKYTDRPIKVVQKGDPLVDAHALVTHNSLMAVGAVRQGIHAYMESGCIDRPWSELEEPICWDRVPWANALSWSQWTLQEIKSGICWNEVKKQAAISLQGRSR